MKKCPPSQQTRMGDLVKNEKVSALAADADGGLSKKNQLGPPPCLFLGGDLVTKNLESSPLLVPWGGLGLRPALSEGME